MHFLDCVTRPNQQNMLWAAKGVSTFSFFSQKNSLVSSSHHSWLSLPYQSVHILAAPSSSQGACLACPRGGVWEFGQAGLSILQHKEQQSLLTWSNHCSADSPHSALHWWTCKTNLQLLYPCWGRASCHTWGTASGSGQRCPCLHCQAHHISCWNLCDLGF